MATGDMRASALLRRSRADRRTPFAAFRRNFLGEIQKVLALSLGNYHATPLVIVTLPSMALQSTRAVALVQLRWKTFEFGAVSAHVPTGSP